MAALAAAESPLVDDLRRARVALDPELIDVRRAVHRRPELAFEEHHTAELVAARLRRLGFDAHTGVGRTGVIADLDCGDGPALLLRADMDALPLDEVAGRSHGSEHAGRMHACGHDAHTSALLGAAALLVARSDELAGRVRFLFQPAEETGAGAVAVIADGALEGIDEAVAEHVSSFMPYGTVGLRVGDYAVGADQFALAVHGRGGHSGIAHTARDTVFAAAQLVTALQTLPRESPPGQTLAMSIASISGGIAPNVVAESVTLRGTLRWLDRRVRDHAVRRLDEIAKGICDALRVEGERRILATVPVLRCAEGPTDHLREGAQASGATVIDPGIIPASEDFANIAERVPAGFVSVGAQTPGGGAHHAPEFDIDERAIGLSAEILARTALAKLGR